MSIPFMKYFCTKGYTHRIGMIVKMMIAICSVNGLRQIFYRSGGLMHHAGAAFRNHLADDQHQGPFVTAVDIHGGIEISVPVSHSVEQRKGGQRGLHRGTITFHRICSSLAPSM